MMSKPGIRYSTAITPSSSSTNGSSTNGSSSISSHSHSHSDSVTSPTSSTSTFSTPRTTHRLLPDNSSTTSTSTSHITTSTNNNNFLNMSLHTPADSDVNLHHAPHSASIPSMPDVASALGLGRPPIDVYSSSIPHNVARSAHSTRTTNNTIHSAGIPPNRNSTALDLHYRQIERAERMLEEMRHAQLDAAFTEELRAIEEWFKVLTEIERSTALYALFQYMTPIQIRFFSTVLNSMSRRADPAALFTPTLSDRMEPPLLGDYDMPSYSMDAMHEQIAAMQRQQRHGPVSSVPRPNRYSDMDPSTFVEGPRSALPVSHIYDQPHNLGNTWSSGPGSAPLHPPPGFGSAPMNGGPPATPFADHPSAMQHNIERALSPRQQPTSLENKNGEVIHPSRQATSWRSASRPVSPAIPQRELSTPKSGSLQTPPTWGSSSATSSISFDQVRSPNRPTTSTTTTTTTPTSTPLVAPTLPSSGSSRSAGLTRPGSAHGQRSVSSGKSAGNNNNNNHNRTNSNGSVWGSVPNSPGSAPLSPGQGSGSGSGSSSGSKPSEVVDVELLKYDIPAWLRSLRLHKYTPVLENVRWDKLISLNDAELTTLGVSAQGARAKFLKVFAQVNAELNLRNTAPNADDIAATATDSSSSSDL